jgi:UDP-N-acetylglucosamine 2-epimerase
MSVSSPNDFQNGVIELFKVRKTYELNIMDCQKKGDVTCELVHKLYIIIHFYINIGQ